MASTEFLPENDFKTSSTLNFPKQNSPGFGDMEANKRHEPLARFFSMCPSTYDLNIKIGWDT